MVSNSKGLWVRKFKLLLLALALGTCFAAHSDEPNSAGTLTFKLGMATRSGDRSHLYLLLGGGWFRGLRFGDTGGFVADWLKEHPHATFQAISRMGVTNTRNKLTSEWVYIWVEEDAASLNVDLVRAGYFPGAAMADMVDNDQGMLATLNDPKLADEKIQVLKERADNPQDLPRRLVSEEDYARRMDRIAGAEKIARDEKLGIWSDAMRDEREAEGYR